MRKVFAPGFRFSFMDGAIILVALLMSVLVYEKAALLSFFILFVVCHFFLFCNLVRMSRKPELIWSLCFVILSIFSIKLNLLSTALVFLLSTILTLFLVGQEFKKASYHGVFWQRINPELLSWFNRNYQSENDAP